jgi:hypothetical protein
VDGQPVEVRVLGIRNEGWTLAQCDAAVATAAEVHTGRCGPPLAARGPDRDLAATTVTAVAEEAIAAVDGSTVDCRARRVACVFALASDTGTLATLPIGFRVDPVLTVAPDTGLLAGEPLTVSATGLVPGGRYSLLTCHDRPAGWFGDAGCAVAAAEAPVVTASDEGELTTTTPALQAFTEPGGRRVVCRDDCSVLLVRAEPEYWYQYLVAGYAMAEGSLAASPATGLADGDPVAVTGTDLMATYDGPLVWFVRAGAWALGQCGAGIVDEPSVAGVFRHCAVPPGGGAVEVPGSTLSAELAVQATIAPLAGPPVDCRSAPGACVVTLARYEQDGGTTVLTTPLTFTP